MQSLSSLLRLVALLYAVDAFRPTLLLPSAHRLRATLTLQQQSTSEAATTSFIDTELRAAAMRLHTREQAPKEGKAPSEKPAVARAHVPTHADYLRFLVDSQHVYQAFEDTVNAREELKIFRNTGLERTDPLETDIEFMVQEYNLVQPVVGKFGRDYAAFLRNMESIPEFVCHYYNFYFAHTAGGRMIGKQMSALLLDKKTLEFYKWNGDLNELKGRVKGYIEDMAATWSSEERNECVDATPDTFRYAGAINTYLAGQGAEED